jgi:tetratricopeptide (TPR) repeat protein
MASINLRDYLKGIEELIDGGQTDEALAHCRHILKSFPKNIDTYRLMGKAYLESKRHSEASDLFQRVLSSIPDDFVAHIGMSIIREDESNVDASIWHMERAFESQPSNRAVQDELRRLYGKREGYEPPKVRLTRGALARMYSHGDLYNQAIGELRGALAEDAQRPDLQVLLAEMYFRTNQHTEAIEVCTQIIQKLPYCLYANRLMVDILRNSQRDVEANPYWERVEELDPYAAQVSTQKSIDSASADSVTLDKLEIESAKAVKPPKAWTSSLSLPAERTFEKEELPDWLSMENLEEPPAESKPEVKPSTSVLGNLENLEPANGTGELPGQSSEEKQSGAPAFTSISKSTALRADQVPDWLRDLRPMTGSLPAIEQPADDAQEEAPPAEPRWTDELKQAGFKPTGPLDLGDTQPKADERETDAGNALSWLDETPDATSSQTTKSITNELPGWLQEEDKVQTPATPANKPSFSAGWIDDTTAETAAEPQASPAKPSWMDEFEKQAEEPHSSAATAAAFSAANAFDQQPAAQKATEPEAGDWLSSLKADATSSPQELDTDTGPIGEPDSGDRLDALSSWDTQVSAVGQPATEPQTDASVNKEDDDNLSWLEGLAAKQGAAEEELLTTPEEREEAKPEWLNADKPKSETLAWLDELSASADAPKGEAEQDTEPMAELEPLEDFEDLNEPALEGETPLPTSAPVAEAKPSPNLEETTPAWLRALSAEMEKTAPAEPIQPRPMEEAPSWLKDLEPQPKTEAPIAEEADNAPSPVASEPWKQMETSGDLDWLESEAPMAEEPAPKIENTWLPAAELQPEEQPEPVEGNFEDEPDDKETEPMSVSTPQTEPAAKAPTRKKTAGLRRHTRMLNEDELEDRISQARQALSYGNITDAAEAYGYLLRRRIRLDEVIADLSAALRRFPRQVALWQTLGDAYMRNNQLREALDCYTKAEALL